jgi:nucleoside-diphosphate-sugar epimerase
MDVLVYDSLLYERDYRKNVNFVAGDVRQREKLERLLDDFNPDSVVWLAAIVGDGACAVNPDETIEVNELAVKWLSETFKRRIVFTSTCSVYGKGEGLLNEGSAKNPLSLYASTKLKCESFLKGGDSVVFRLGTLHGVSDQFSRIRMDLVVNILSLKAMLGEPLNVFGGDQWRPLLHVRDAAAAVAQASIETDDKPYLPPGIYNLNQQNMTIRELAERIKKVSIGENPVEIRYSDLSFEDQRNYRVTSNKYDEQPAAVKFLKTVEDGALEIMTLIKQGRIKSPYSPNFHNQRYLQEEKNGRATDN